MKRKKNIGESYFKIYSSYKENIEYFHTQLTENS